MTGISLRATGDKLDPYHVVAMLPVPDGMVPRRGGHGVAARDLTSQGADRAKLQGFTAFLEANGSLRLEFLSRTLNRRHPDQTLPAEARGAVRSAVEANTGRATQ